MALSRHDILQTWGANQTIPGLTVIQMLYLGIFLFAELAFVLMAFREYAYGLLKIAEIDVLGGPVGSLGKAKLPPPMTEAPAITVQSLEAPMPTSLRHSQRDAS